VSDVPVIRERVEEFESLRGLMAMWVLLGHVALTFSFPAFEHWIWWQILCANRKAVDIFIVLSGFVIFYMLDTKREKYSVYLMRRFLRIFPAYIVCLIFSLMMVHLSVEGLNAIPDPSPRDVDRLVIFQSSLRYFGPHVLAHVTIRLYRTSLEHICRVAILSPCASRLFSCHDAATLDRTSGVSFAVRNALQYSAVFRGGLHWNANYLFFHWLQFILFLADATVMVGDHRSA
jgi:peptidoglycan/LPS O-acetylase OafA/YrhL